MRTKTYTRKELSLTLEGHQWYWECISDRMLKGKQTYPHHHLPLLHNYYAYHKKDMPNFPTFEVWFSAIDALGRAIQYFDLKPTFLSVTDRYARLLAFLIPRTYRGKRYIDHEVKKWCKQWEPTEEVWREKKERREKKKAWRDCIGKDRDRRKVGYTRGPIKFYKRERIRLHRGWVKQRLLSQDWDAFHDREVYEMFNSWYWW